MIIVHAVTQVIADYDGRIFLSIVDKIPKFVLYCIVYPLVIIGLWGISLHRCNCNDYNVKYTTYSRE